MVRISNSNILKSIQYAYFHSIINYGIIIGATLPTPGRFSLKKKLTELWLVNNPQLHVEACLNNQRFYLFIANIFSTIFIVQMPTSSYSVDEFFLCAHIIYNTVLSMIIEFYTVKIVYICVFMTCSTSKCLCETLMHQLLGGRYIDRQIDRQTDRQTGRQAG